GDEAFAVDLDAIAVGVGAGAELLDDAAVEADAAFGDHAFGGAARSDAGACENLLQAFTAHAALTSRARCSARVVDCRGRGELGVRPAKTTDPTSPRPRS